MFMSCEILTECMVALDLYQPPNADSAELDIYPLEDSNEEETDVQELREMTSVQHSLSHDLESFFWVLMWLCIYRAGPARARNFQHDSPDFKSVDEARKVINVVIRTFEDDRDWEQLGSNKKLVFTINGVWPKLKGCVHPYFQPLLPLLDALHHSIKRLLVKPENRSDELSLDVGRKMIVYLERALQARHVQEWDREGKRGGEAIYEESRRKELERRADEARLTGTPGSAALERWKADDEKEAVEQARTRDEWREHIAWNERLMRITRKYKLDWSNKDAYLY